MDLVFANKNLTHTEVASVDGNIYYNILTRFPSDSPVPVTAIETTKTRLPLMRMSQEEFRKLPTVKTKTGRKYMAFIEWQSAAGRPGLFHHDLFSQSINHRGLRADSFMKMREKKRNSVLQTKKGSDPKDQTFRGNDQVWYRWKVDPCYGSLLTRRDDGKEIAIVRRQKFKDGFFADTIHHAVHISNPDELTLDVSMLLMSFLWVDHPRLIEDVGVREWAPKRIAAGRPDPFYPEAEVGKRGSNIRVVVSSG